MRLDEYAAYDGIGLAALLAKGEVTPRDLGKCVTDAVAALNPQLNAVVELYDDAIAALPAGAGPGPFHGLPILTKDFPIEAGRPAEFGSRLAKGHRARHDSVFWTRLRAGGLVNIGRTASSEFGIAAATETQLYGATRNPWDTTRGVAGSSGGTAAAVAAGIVPFAQGSDGGGSIRTPASFCGVIGLKPSRGRITGSPGANAPLLGIATAFMLTRSIRDTALLLDLGHGPDAGDGYEIAPPVMPYAQAIERAPVGLRVALCTTSWSGYPIDPEIVAAVEATGRQLQALGHHVEIASPQFDYEAYLAAQKVIWAAESAASLPALAHALNRPIDETTVGSTVLALHRYGLTVSGAQLVDALEVYDTVTRAVGRFMADYDLLLTPTCAALPEKIGTYDPARPGLTLDDVFADLAPKETFSALFNATGLPAISLPLGQSAAGQSAAGQSAAEQGTAGLPIGLQFIARFGREDILLALARVLEGELRNKSAAWPARPPLHVGNLSGI